MGKRITPGAVRSVRYQIKICISEKQPLGLQQHWVGTAYTDRPRYLSKLKGVPAWCATIVTEIVIDFSDRAMLVLKNSN